MRVDLFGGDEGITDERSGIEVGFFEVDSGDLVVVVAGVVEETLFGIIAVGIDGDFVFIITEVGAAALLVDGVEDVEELADAARLIVGGEGMGASEGGFHEARLRTEVAGEADGAHAATIFMEGNLRSESIDGAGGGEVHIII